MFLSFPRGVAHLAQPKSRGMAGGECRNRNELLGTRSLCAAERERLAGQCSVPAHTSMPSHQHPPHFMSGTRERIERMSLVPTEEVEIMGKR